MLALENSFSLHILWSYLKHLRVYSLTAFAAGAFHTVTITCVNLLSVMESEGPAKTLNIYAKWAVLWKDSSE